MRNIRRIFFFGFIFIVSLLIAGNEIPNEVITENPKKEVTKIESKKLKEKAELEIKVKKRTPIKVLGRARTDGKVMYLLEKPKDKAEKRVTYFVTENLQEIQNLNPKARTRGVETTVEEEETDTVLTVSSDKKVYIAEIDGGKVGNIYIGEKQASNRTKSFSQVTSGPFIIDERIYVDSTKPVSFTYTVYDWWFGADQLRWLDITTTQDSQIEDTDIYYKTSSPGNVENFIELNVKGLADKVRGYVRGLGERSPNGPGWGYRSPGDSFYYGGEGNYLTKNVANWFWIQNMKNVETYYKGDTAMRVYMGDIRGKSEGPSNPNYELAGVYRYKFKANLRFDDSDYPTEVEWTYIVDTLVERNNIQNVYIYPSSSQIVEMLTGKVMSGESAVNGHMIPGDWRFRYDDSGESASSKQGLYMIVNSSNCSIEQLGKRRVRITNGSLFDVEVWLENVNGLAKLRYKVNKASENTTRQLEIVVSHEAHGRILYSDVIYLNIPQRPIKEIGSATFTIDQRLQQLTEKWISGDGQVYRGLNMNGVDYKELIKLNSSWSQLPSDRIEDVQMIEGRPYLYGSGTTLDNKTYKQFLVSQSAGWKDESAAIYGFNLPDLNNNLRVSMNNKSSNPNLDNIFYLIGTNNIYKGNIRESYIGDQNPIATATADFREVTGEAGYGQWNQGVNGTAAATGGENKFKLIFDSGNSLFDFIGKRSNKTMVTKVTIQEGTGEVKQSGEVSNPGERVSVDGTHIRVGFEGTWMFINRLKRNTDADKTYTVKAYYKDILLGTLTLKLPKYEAADTIDTIDPIDIGEIVVNIDNRLRQQSNDWVYASEGKVAANLSSTGVKEDYKELITTTGSLTASSVQIQDVESVVGRSERVGVYTNVSGNKNVLFKDVGTYYNESGIPTEFDLSTINDRVLISINNGISPNNDNRFTLIGTDKKRYQGNFKENYFGDRHPIATATADFREVTGEEGYGQWNQGVNGTAAATGGENKFKLIFDSGNSLFNFIGKRSNKTMVTKVTIQEETGEVKQSGEVSNPGGRVSVDGTHIRVGFEGTWMFIRRLKRNTDADKTYTVKAYYKDIVLGTLKLKLPKYEAVDPIDPIDIGEIVVNIDNRLKQQSNGWVYASEGKVAPDISGGAKEDYKELITTTGSLTASSVQIQDVESVAGRSEKVGVYTDVSGNKNAWFKNSGTYDNESGIPTEFDLSAINDRVLISINNGTSPNYDNRFTLIGIDGKSYQGNFKENYTGDQNPTATATLDTREDRRVNPYGQWGVGVSGTAVSKNNKDFILKFSKGSLFDFIGKRMNKTMVTKIVIKESGKEDVVVEGVAGSRIEAGNGHIKVGFEADIMFIHKSKLNEIEDKVYIIEAWYNDIKLGTLNLTVLKDYPEYTPIRFQIDKRLVAKNGYINAQGQYKYSRAEFSKTTKDTKVGSYPKLVKVIESDYPNKETTVEGVMGYSEVVTENGYNFNYIEGVSNDVKAIAVKSGAVNNLLSQYTYVWKKLGENWTTGRIKTTDSELIPIKVEEIGEEAVISDGVIDFTKSQKREAKWQPNSSGESDVSEISIAFSPGGKVFNPRSKANTTQTSIATKLIIKNKTGSELVRQEGKSGTELTASLDTGEMFKINTDGSLTIRGGATTGEETYIVETYYEDILLGKMTLTLKTKTSLVIEGDDEFNFGQILKGRTYNLSGDILIKNPGGVAIVDVEFPTEAKMIHQTKTNETIPLKIAGTTLSKDSDIKTRINLTATTDKNQEAGNYKGEFLITVTIN